MRLFNLQKEQKDWQLRNFGERPAYEMALGVAEEAGELCHAELKMLQGIRGDKQELLDKAKDAVGDIVIYLAGYCNAHGIDFEDAVTHTWERVRQRDWTTNKLTGGDIDKQIDQS